MPQLQLFLLELGQKGFTCFVCIRDLDEIALDEGLLPSYRVQPRKGKAQSHMDKEEVLNIVSSAQSMDREIKSCIFLCLPIDQVQGRKPSGSNQEESPGGISHSEETPEPALSQKSLEDVLKRRIEESFPPRSRFAMWRIASFLLHTPNLQTDGRLLYLKNDRSKKKKVDIIGFLHLVGNRSLHLMKDKAKLKRLKQEYGEIARVFKSDSNIPESFAPALSALMESSNEAKNRVQKT